MSCVTCSKHVAEANYDRMSRWYDIIAGSSEWKFVKVGLEMLTPVEWEKIRKISYGAGKSVLASNHSPTGGIREPGAFRPSIRCHSLKMIIPRK
jgi:hypothetical protein